MKLYQLAYACRLYQGDFDNAYRDMRCKLGDNPGLASRDQQNDLLHFLNKWGCRIPETQFDTLKSHLKDWAEKWVRKLPDVGAGPAGSIAYNPPTHNLCISGGIGVSAGHNLSVGPLTGYSLSGEPLTPQEIDNVLSGGSVSGGYNLPTGPVPVGPGPTGSINSAGILLGPTLGIAGGSASATTAFCSEVHF